MNITIHSSFPAHNDPDTTVARPGQPASIVLTPGNMVRIQEIR